MIIFDAGEIYNKPKKKQKKQYNRKKMLTLVPCFPAFTNNRFYSNLPNTPWQITYSVSQWGLQKSNYAGIHNYTEKASFINEIHSVTWKSLHARYVSIHVGTSEFKSFTITLQQNYAPRALELSKLKTDQRNQSQQLVL